MKTKGCYKCGGNVSKYSDGGDLSAFNYNPLGFMEEGGDMMMQESAPQQENQGQGSSEEQLIMQTAQILMEQGEEAAYQFLAEQGFSEEEIQEVFEVVIQVIEQQQGGGSEDSNMMQQEEQMMEQEMAPEDMMMRRGGLAKFVTGGNSFSYYNYNSENTDEEIPQKMSNPYSPSYVSDVLRSYNPAFSERQPQPLGPVNPSDIEQFHENTHNKYEKIIEEKQSVSNPNKQDAAYTLTHSNRLDKLDPNNRDLMMAYLSGLASPSNINMQMLRQMPGGKGLAAVGSALSIPGSVYMGVRKFTMPKITQKFDKDGTLIGDSQKEYNDKLRLRSEILNNIKKNGGEWNPFEDNRRRLKVNMSAYDNGGGVSDKYQGLISSNPNVSQSDIDEYRALVQKIKSGTADDVERYRANLFYESIIKPYENSNPPVFNNQFPEESSISSINNKATHASFNKDLYGKSFSGDAAGTMVATNTLNAMHTINDFLDFHQSKRLENDLKRRQRNAGNSMNLNTRNPVNPFGSMYTLNAGPGANQNVAQMGHTQDFGTFYNSAKYGGDIKYEEGGEYELTDEEIEALIKAGGEIEYLD